MKILAEPAIRAVEEERIRFIPENWSKVYFEWMRNIHDWCISRQLWWGHRIPAWYCDNCSNVTVEVDEPKQCPRCGSHQLHQETDVLDTWFSSVLWPFSVFGWPEKTKDLEYYYPTNLLVTGFDIIFFWVARMIMFGLKFTGAVPFREVFIHGLVRDESGQKMSKSKGNVLDPIELIEEYGADALRFTLAILAVPGPDVPLAPKRIQGYKAFINKLWNSVRFALMKVNEEEARAPLARSFWDLGDRWITSRFNRVAGKINSYLREYRFDLAANAAYQFLWHEFCDWYIEWIKPHLNDDQPHAQEKKGLLMERISEVLRLLHPFIPFVTEYLWQQLPDEWRREKTLAVASYPLQNDELLDADAEAEFEFIMELVGKIRQVRTEINIEPSKKINVLIRETPHRNLIELQKKEILLLTRSEKIEFVAEFPSDVPLARGILKDAEVAINLATVLDLKSETERLTRELKKIETELMQAQKKLANENFMKNAPAEIVAEQKAKYKDLNDRKSRTEETLRSLSR